MKKNKQENKMEMIRKFYNGVIKETNEEERTLTVLITTPAKDRMGESVDAKGVNLENYKKNPVVLWAHNYSIPPIAKTLWIKKSKEGITAKPQFAKTAFAEEIFQLYKDGFLNAWSIGFMPEKWVDGDEGDDIKRTYEKCELLEYSAVPVPANPEAITQIRSIVKSKIIVDAVEKEQKKLGEEVLKPEETDDYIRLPVAEPKSDDTIRTITVSEKEGIQALYAVERKLILTYIFDKAKEWTMAKAKKWVEDHKDDEKIMETIMEEIKAKYTCECIKCGHKIESDKHCKDLKCSECGGQMRRAERPGPGQDGGKEVTPAKETPKETEPKTATAVDISEYTVEDLLIAFEGGVISKDEALKRANEIIEEAGIQIETEDKAGAVLNKKNKDNLKKSQELIQQVLDSSGAVVEDEEPKKAIKDPKPEPENTDKNEKPKDDKPLFVPVSEKEKEVKAETVISSEVAEVMSQKIADAVDKAIRKITGKVS